ncbi:MAG: hypothetical protein KME27_23150 [Lyngbya sp. HA4199-MV5]|jgi:hypothetical protein|nr:hypothetical protein [Lyngbya sp. HA4199-MV5]
MAGSAYCPPLTGSDRPSIIRGGGVKRGDANDETRGYDEDAAHATGACNDTSISSGLTVPCPRGGALLL